jgi:alpha-glucosidase (family GH31 glycosyl hydrolase)
MSAFHYDEFATKLAMTTDAKGALSGKERKTVFERRILSFVAVLTLASQISPPNLAAQTQPFSSGAQYKAMVEGLHGDPILPSRMGSGTLLATAQAPANLKVIETAAALRLETAAWRLEVTKTRWAMALTNKQTGLTWQLGDSGDNWSGLIWALSPGTVSVLRPGKVQSIERHGDLWQMRVDVAGSTTPAALEIAVISPSVIRLSIRAPQPGGDARLGLNLAGAGPFFGLGERFDRVKLDGAKMTLHPEDLLGNTGHNWTYIPTPFLFTPQGLGIYLDTPDISSVDLGESQQHKLSIQLDHSSADAYFFVGEPKSILEDYTSLTGRSPLPPPWAFGVWVCSLQGARAVIQDAQRLRQEAIPASAIWTFDAMDKGDIMGWPFWTSGYYPDLPQFTSQLHAMGFKVLTYVHPYVPSVLDPYNLPSPSFEQGVRTGLFVHNAHGETTGPANASYLQGGIDFTSPTTVDWWEQKILEILVKDNFDGWMEDFGEYVTSTDLFAAGVTGREMANLYPLFYHKITYEIARKAKPDVVEFSRSGSAGSQGYSRAIWGGDQFPDWSQDRGLPSVVRAGITAGLSGFAVWGPDILDSSHSKELWTRWAEFGALTPIMRDHLWDKPAGAVSLWYDSQTMDTFRNYARLHISLFPYFYGYASEAEKTGLPIIRHLLLEFPDDPKTYDVDGEYMLGEKLLVAPVLTEGASTRSLYLPKGSWVDYWTGLTMDGGRQVTVPAPLEHIPILVRSGSIVPFISPDTQTLASDLAESKYRTVTNDLTWRVFPASSPVQDSFTLNDGTVANSSEEPSRIEVRVEHSPGARKYEVILPASRAPREVTVGGKPVPEIDKAGGRAEQTSWRMDAASQTLHVLLQSGDFHLTIVR